jgi:hypothetical protein
VLLPALQSQALWPPKKLLVFVMEFSTSWFAMRTQPDDADDVSLNEL